MLGISIYKCRTFGTGLDTCWVSEVTMAENKAMESLENNNITIGAKIITHETPEDGNGRVGRLIAKVPSNSFDEVEFKRGQIDTAAPFASVKAAVSKFGGIIDWKAHRVQTVERRRFIEQELEKGKDEIPMYKKQSEAAEEAKNQVLKELDDTKRLVEDLKLNLERVQREEQQAKQDAELAKLRVEELEQGIADDASFAAKAQLEVARARYTAAVSELKTVNEEMEQLREDYTLLVSENDAATKNAEEAVTMSKEIERVVEDLTIELITAKESLDSAHAAHLEAEENRMEAITSKKQDVFNWEEDLKQAEEELEELKKKIVSTKDLRSKLDVANALLQDLKSEITAYMESKVTNETVAEGDPKDAMESKTHGDFQAAIAAAKNELEEVTINTENAINEVKLLKVAAASLNLELEQEKMELAAIQLREGNASVTIKSLQAELKRTNSEIASIQARRKEEKQKLVNLPNQVQLASHELDQVKALADIAREGLRKAQEETEHVKAGANTIKNRLRATQREIESSRASEKLALAAITALEESESAQINNTEDSSTGVTLSLEEYYELSKKAHEADEQAKMRVVAALSEIEIAKESELRSLDKLEEANRELSGQKNALEVALEKAEKANEGKLGVEQELRRWRSDQEQRHRDSSKNRRTSSEDGKESKSFFSTPKSFSRRLLSSKSQSSSSETEYSPEVKVAKKKKKSLFPRILTFLGRKKAQSSKLL